MPMHQNNNPTLEITHLTACKVKLIIKIFKIKWEKKYYFSSIHTSIIKIDDVKLKMSYKVSQTNLSSLASSNSLIFNVGTLLKF